MKYTKIKCFLAVFVCLVLMGAPLIGYSAEMVWPKGKISLYANKDPLKKVLANVSISAGIPININKGINDVVSFKFVDETREDIFDTLVSAYGLAWYYDGTRLYIDKLVNAKSETIKLENISVDSFETHLLRLGVIDDSQNYKWNAIKHRKIVDVSGPEAFVKKVVEMSKILDKKSESITFVYQWTDKRGVVHMTQNSDEAPRRAKVLEM